MLRKTRQWKDSMKKTLLIFLCVSLFTASVSLGRDKPLANEGNRGLYARSIEQVLRLNPEEVDLAIAALIVSEQWSNMVVGRKYLSQLDDMALEIRARLKNAKLENSYKAITVINKYLFDELGFESVSTASDPNDLFLHSVLDRKRGYCLSLSILYLSIGERLGLPLYGVVVPGHFFVRYDDGRVRFNIETTSKGGYADDKHYIEKFKVPDEETQSIYMINLSKIQTLGCFFNNLGNSYSDSGNTEQALMALERAVNINPYLAESRTNLGNIYLRKEQVQEAIYQYQKALQINPLDPKTHNNLGNAYMKQDRPNDAIFQYNHSLRLDPAFIDAYKNLASAYCTQGLFSYAVEQLKKAIILEPQNASLYNQLGDVYNQMGDYELAILKYKKALTIGKNSPESHYGLAICYNKLGLFDEEIREYKEALNIKPDLLAALINLGNAYFAKQNYDTAIELYEKAAQVSPREAAIHYNLGAAYSNKGNYERAVAEYLKEIQIEPDMSGAHNGLAFAFYKLKKYDLAAKHIKIADKLGADIDPDLLAAIEDKLK